ncbi:hypothetical protein [Devosia rhizoryzae]|uniref:Uncharacterized protein n=1 Tax=Devosia rhizoryzae TaxID=2774137 RepID=A0ABX7C7F6_9HYPH|nr:hypothetical protein [Devosia rhizoryzae]QQR40192.1 hypothetical protein JI748_04050 [Devosia rhizoryzae]
MRHLPFALALLSALTLPAAASEFGDKVRAHLYAGTLSEMGEQIAPACDAGDAEACFAFGLSDLITGYEQTAQMLYRHGAVAPNAPALSLFLGTGLDTPPATINADARPLDYDGLVQILDDFVVTLGQARAHFEAAGNGDAFVMPIDPLRVRIDLDGNGAAEPGETLAVVLQAAGELTEFPSPDEPPPGHKTKTKSKGAPDATIGFDNADAIWFAGYSTLVSTPVDFLLAHDFSQFFDAFLHRVFPHAGLPMGGHLPGGMMVMDPESDAFFADVIAAIHAADFPVTDAARLANVRTRLLEITALSRRNWELILAETDDDRELVPSPTQTSLVPDRQVTQDVVDAWLATLDTVDLVLEGELLLPHWRFAQGFDLKRYFETATETDAVMLFTGLGALPFLGDGPIAGADDFAEANRVFGEDWPFFALWFN